MERRRFKQETPLDQRLEIVERVGIAAGQLAVDEIEPEALANKAESGARSRRRRRVLHLGVSCDFEHRRNKHTARRKAQQDDRRNSSKTHAACATQNFFVTRQPDVKR